MREGRKEGEGGVEKKIESNNPSLRGGEQPL